MEENMTKNKVFLIITVVLMVIMSLILGWQVGSKVKQKEDSNTLPESQSIHKTPQTTDDITYAFLQLENNKQNMLYSPLSIKYALKMLSEGADGQTKEEIDKLIKDIELTKYQDIAEHLSLANAIFIRNDFKEKVNNNFIKQNQEKYNAEIIFDDFADATNINNWINEKTLNLINKALKDEDISPDTKLIITNALAIVMNFKEQFNANDTSGQTFYLENNEEYLATTMRRKTTSENTSYYQDSNITVLATDLEKYENTELEFIAIMPNNLNEYIKEFNSKELDNIDSKLIKASSTKAGLNIYIPKFKFEYELNLQNDLEKLGVKDAFDTKKANFKNISDDSIYVSRAIHKANIDFSEEGIKASAVTVFAFDTAALEENKPIDVRINKPFMFIIRDKNTKENWFTGTVYKPNSWEQDKEDYSAKS